MSAVATIKRENIIDAMEENQQEIRKMVMESYQDMQNGKGRDYKEFFTELENRYRNSIDRLEFMPKQHELDEDEEL